MRAVVTGTCSLAHEGNISLLDTKDVFTITRTGLRFPVRADLFLSAGLERDWDNVPAEVVERSDYRYILSLGYGFETIERARQDSFGHQTKT